MTTAETEIGAAQRDNPSSGGRLRVALLGGFGIGNFGNDASLEAIAAYLRRAHPQAALSVICTVPDAISKRFGLPAYPMGKAPRQRVLRWIDVALLRMPRAIANWIYSFQLLGRFDVVLLAGTGVFDDYRDSPLGWPSRLLRWAAAARARGVRLAFVSVGAGPIVSPISRPLMKLSARLAQHRSYRDAESRAFMESIGLSEKNSPVLPDLAFLLPAPKVERAANAPLTIGVGIMNYRGWRDSNAAFDAYVATHVRLIQWIEAKGHKVRILIGQAPVDFKAVTAIEERLGRSIMTAREREMNSFHDAMLAAAEADIVVASRYHVQIAALKVGRPLISLSYAPKNDALLAQAGLGEFAQPVEQVDFDKLTSQIEALLDKRASYAAIVAERVAAMESQLEAAIGELDVLEAAAPSRSR